MEESFAAPDRTLSLVFEISTFVAWVLCFIHSIFFHAHELLHVSSLAMTTIYLHSVLVIFAVTAGLHYAQESFYVWIGPVPLFASLFWAVLLHICFVPSRQFNKHQRGFLLGSVVIDTLQMFTSAFAIEPVCVGLGFWWWDTTDYFGISLLLPFTFLILTFTYSLFYHTVLRKIKSTTNGAKISLFRLLGPFMSVVLSFFLLCVMWIVYAWIGGVKCIFPFIPTQRKPLDQNFPRAMQLSLLAAFYMTCLLSSFYYARYYRLTNKYSFGRVLLPLIISAFYILLVVFLLINRLNAVVLRYPVILAVLCVALVFHLFIHILPFSRDLLARASGERVVFEDPLLFWTGEGEIQEWDMEDAYGSMKDLTALPMIQEMMQDAKGNVGHKRVSIAGDI